MNQNLRVLNVVRHFGVKADNQGLVLDVVLADEVRKGEIFKTHQLPGMFQCGQVTSRKDDHGRWRWVARCEWKPAPKGIIG